MKHLKTTENNIVYDVIIAGAGPVGLFLACELALAKCSVLILEKAKEQYSPLKQLPFGVRGLSSHTIESFYRRGLLHELELHKRIKKPIKPGAPRQGGHFAGIPFNDENIDFSQWRNRLPTSTPLSLMSEMQEIELVLTRRAESLGVEIKRGIAVSGYQQWETEVSVLAEDQSFSGKWLVGCDGSRSIVRKTAGIAFAGTEPQFTGYTMLVDLSDPEKLKLGRNVTQAGMYMQSQPGYVIIQDFDGGAFHDSGNAITLEHAQDVIRRISGTDATVTALHTATTWTDRARQATEYRDGRVLLAGDAAHIHAPLGGQGLNLGLGDAMNLGWKLSATIKNQVPEELLDTYFAERYPIGEQILNWSRAQVAVMRPDMTGRALHALISDLMNTPNGTTYFAGRIWGVHTYYELNGQHPLIGYSVPNFKFQDGTCAGELMQDGKSILLDFEMNDSLRNIVSQFADRLKYISGPAEEQLGLSALLIRPDGFVAWASDGNPDSHQVQNVILNWFVAR
jgi:2-polyprenyl-6-methoxyphenol hydroxylase-like FAD-dependent oxidoreductase